MNPWVLANFIGIIFFTVWISMALLNALFPRYFWRIRYGWRAVKEPPSTYFIYQRIGGFIFAGIGIAFLIFINIHH